MFLIRSYPTEVAAASVVSLVPAAILALLFQRRIRNLNIVDPL
jgi:ABC-type glycerol-3-phosphate transport system permease component